MGRLSIEPVRDLVRAAAPMRWSDDAVRAAAAHLERLAGDVGKRAATHADRAGRRTVFPEDVERATRPSSRRDIAAYIDWLERQVASAEAQLRARGERLDILPDQPTAPILEA